MHQSEPLDTVHELGLHIARALLASGYRIEPPPAEAGSPEPLQVADSPEAVQLADSPDDQGLVAALRRLQSADQDALDVAAMLGLWQARRVEMWSREPVVYRLLASRLLGAGEPLMAYDVSDEGLQHWPLDVRLRQLQGLALARSGATERAQHLLRTLYDEGHTDEETLGLLARTHKDLSFATRSPDAAQVQLRIAADLYAEAYTRHGGYWSGINAATLATLSGDRERAQATARGVREQCAALLDNLDRPDRPDRPDEGADAYWLVATLGEASLVLEEWAPAEQWYVRAAEYGRHRLGDLASTRHNARLLLDYAGGQHTHILERLKVPGVAVFSGHMVDRPDRAVARFPRQSATTVKQAIRERLERSDCRIGYASAAAGADILFLESILELGGEATVVLPYDRDQFVHDTAKLVGDAAWIERSQRVLSRATRVIVASQQQSVAGPTTFEFANLLLDGLASNRAEHLETRVVRLAVWDGKPGDGPGGTASAVGRWQRAGLAVDIVVPPLLRGGESARAQAASYGAPSALPQAASDGAPGGLRRVASAGSPSGLTRRENGFRSEIVALLFGDAVHFSKLGEDEIVRFGEHFLGAIGELIGTSVNAPVLKNTWGDGLFFVFSSVRDAGMFALALRDLVNATDWQTKGLPGSLNLRIGLHAGPVFGYTDPITGRPNYLGTQVSRAARIEPVTPPGHVYASEAFAALAAAERIAEFTCDYVGQTPLAKGYGTFPMYHVRPT